MTEQLGILVDAQDQSADSDLPVGGKVVVITADPIWNPFRRLHRNRRTWGEAYAALIRCRTPLDSEYIALPFNDVPRVIETIATLPTNVETVFLIGLPPYGTALIQHEIAAINGPLVIARQRNHDRIPRRVDAHLTRQTRRVAVDGNGIHLRIAVRTSSGRRSHRLRNPQHRRHRHPQIHTKRKASTHLAMRCTGRPVHHGKVDKPSTLHSTTGRSLRILVAAASRTAQRRLWTSNHYDDTGPDLRLGTCTAILHRVSPIFTGHHRSFPRTNCVRTRRYRHQEIGTPHEIARIGIRATIIPAHDHQCCRIMHCRKISRRK